MKKDNNSALAATGNVNGNKVPVIRLKLKVKKEQQQGKMKTDEDKKSLTRNGVDVEEQEEHVHADLKPQSLNTDSADSAPLKFYGTFKYRPFKLFPLLPPSTRYRVLIPAKYTHNLHSHPAVRRNYLWKTSTSLSLSVRDDGVYTDDSDLVCVMVKEGLLKEESEGKGDILVEVEVCDRPETSNVLPADSNSDSNDRSPKIQPRLCSNHDGNYIKIINCHLKR